VSPIQPVVGKAARAKAGEQIERRQHDHEPRQRPADNCVPQTSKQKLIANYLAMSFPFLFSIDYAPNAFSARRAQNLDPLG
jgi:hypothetical protein